MHLRRWLILSALAATALLAIAVAGASARNFRFNERNFELIWDSALGSPKTKLEFIVLSDGNNVQCKVTLLGHFTETTIRKETAGNEGMITHGELSECEGGTATIRTETMPWPFRYRSFTGTLPRIRSMNVGMIGARFKIREPNGVECEAGTEVNHPGVSILGNSAEAPETGAETTGEVENITSERGNRIPLGGEFLCGFGGEAEFGGVGLVRNLPRTAKIRISLI